MGIIEIIETLAVIGEVICAGIMLKYLLQIAWLKRQQKIKKDGDVEMSKIETYKKDIKHYEKLIRQYEKENDEWKNQKSIKIESNSMKINVKGTNRGIIFSGGSLNNATIINNDDPPHSWSKFDYLYRMIEDRKEKIKKLEASA